MGISNPNTTAIFQKSLAVCDISKAVSTYFATEANLVRVAKFAPLRYEIALSLVNDANLIPKSVTEVLTTESKEQRVYQLSLINIMVKNLLSYCNGLENDGVKEKEYVHLLRNEIKSFKRSFKTWRKSFRSI